MPSIALVAPGSPARILHAALDLCLEAVGLAADAGVDVRIAALAEDASVGQLAAEEALSRGGHVTLVDPTPPGGARWTAVLRAVYGPRAVEIVRLDPDRHCAWFHFAALRARRDAPVQALAASHGAIDGAALAILAPASWPADPAAQHAAVMARAFGIETLNLVSLADCHRLRERIQARRIAL